MNAKCGGEPNVVVLSGAYILILISNLEVKYASNTTIHVALLSGNCCSSDSCENRA